MLCFLDHEQVSVRCPVCTNGTMDKCPDYQGVQLVRCPYSDKINFTLVPAIKRLSWSQRPVGIITFNLPYNSIPYTTISYTTIS